MSLMEFDSDRLRFSPFQESDYGDLYSFLSTEDVCRYLPGEKAFNHDQVQKWLDFFIHSFDLDKPNMVYAVREKNKDKVIGYVGYAYVKEFDKNEVMYAFHQDYWGKGYATEASKEMIRLAKVYQDPLVIALADIHNMASQRVLLKLGFKQIKQISLWGLEMFYYEKNMEY